MVLDESALEAMIARQRATEREHEPQESVRTEQNDEFEVYERPESDEPEAPAPRQAPVEGNDEFEVFERAEPAPEPVQPPAPRPQANTDSDEFEVFERPEPEATPEPLPAAEPVAAPEPAPAPVPAHEEATIPQPAAESEPTRVALEPAPEHERAPETVQPTPERRRPQVWPPIGKRQPAEVSRSIPVEEPQSEPSPEPVAEAPAPKPPTHNPTAHNFAKVAVDGSGRRIAIVQALFNQELTDQMVESASKRIEETGAEVAQVLTVPGVYDLPLPVQSLARSKRIDAVVVIGCVVQGSTKHDELITFSTAKTLQEIALATETPIGLGIIGPGMTWEQAEARVGNGAHAVDAVLALLQH